MTKFLLFYTAVCIIFLAVVIVVVSILASFFLSGK